MLGMMINTNMPWAPNAWKVWVDHIMGKKDALGLKKAALAHTNGALASASSGFSISPNEILKLKTYFEDPNNANDSIRLQGKTYIVKKVSKNQLIAFNGHKYFIISKSNKMYVIVLCESREKCDEAATHVNKYASKLMAKDY